MPRLFQVPIVLQDLASSRVRRQGQTFQYLRRQWRQRWQAALRVACELTHAAQSQIGFSDREAIVLSHQALQPNTLPACEARSDQLTPS